MRLPSTTPCPTSGANGTLYWRGTGSDALEESDLSGNAVEEYVFFNGRRVARRDVSTNAVHYYFSDHLGTHAVVENATGTACEQDIDYYPYGGVQHDYCAVVPQNYKFNGKERDAESGLDNFGARYDASNLGRFMTPDWAEKATAVPYANFGNPQSLNLYSYVENNPTTLGDPDGHAYVGFGDHVMMPCSGGGPACGEEWWSFLRETSDTEQQANNWAQNPPAKDDPKPLTPREWCEKYPDLCANAKRQRHPRSEPFSSGAGTGCERG